MKRISCGFYIFPTSTNCWVRRFSKARNCCEENQSWNPMLGEAASGRTKFGKRFCFQWDPVFPHNIAYVIYADNAFMDVIQSLPRSTSKLGSTYTMLLHNSFGFLTYLPRKRRVWKKTIPSFMILRWCISDIPIPRNSQWECEDFNVLPFFCRLRVLSETENVIHRTALSLPSSDCVRSEGLVIYNLWGFFL